MRFRILGQLLVYTISNLFCVGLASASSSGNRGNEIQYRGVLYQSGLPTNGSFDFRFGLFGELIDPAFCLEGPVVPPPGSCGLWAEERQGIQIANGRFAVVLGEATPPLVEGTIPTAVFNQSQLYLAIAIRAVGTSNFVLLGGGGQKQRIVPSPYSLSASGGLDSRIRQIEGRIGEYCGLSQPTTGDASFNGQLGWGAIGELCRSTVGCNPQNAHMCTVHEITLDAQRGVVVPFPGGTSDRGWIASGLNLQISVDNDFRDCEGFRTAGAAFRGAVWAANAFSNSQIGHSSSCMTSRPVVCCHSP